MGLFLSFSNCEAANLTLFFSLEEFILEWCEWSGVGSGESGLKQRKSFVKSG